MNTTSPSGSHAEAVRTMGIHHLGLTVADIAATAQFFQQQLNFKVVGEKPDYPAVFVSDGSVMLTLWQAKDPTNAIAFNRHNNIGLHHFALKVAGSAALDQLYQQLSRAENVSIEFGPEPLGQSPARHMMCTIPGGLRLELFSDH